MLPRGNAPRESNGNGSLSSESLSQFGRKQCTGMVLFVNRLDIAADQMIKKRSLIHKRHLAGESLDKPGRKCASSKGKSRDAIRRTREWAFIYSSVHNGRCPEFIDQLFNRTPVRIAEVCSQPMKHIVLLSAPPFLRIPNLHHIRQRRRLAHKSVCRVFDPVLSRAWPEEKLSTLSSLRLTMDRFNLFNGHPALTFRLAGSAIIKFTGPSPVHRDEEPLPRGTSDVLLGRDHVSGASHQAF